MEQSWPTDLKNLQKLIWVKNPEKVYFYSTPVEALMTWAKVKNISENDVVGVIAPYPEIFEKAAQALKIKLIEIPRDPEQIVSLNLNQFKAVWLSNPNICDGFFYPKELFDLLLDFFKTQNDLQILCEESTRYFYENSESDLVGSLEKHLDNERFTLMSGTYAFSNEELSWLIQSSSQLEQIEIPNFEGEKQHRLFSLHGGRQMSYVYKQLWVQEHKLGRFVEKLRPLFNSKLVSMPHWPFKLALNLVIDISPYLKNQNLDYSSWWNNLEDSKKKFLSMLPSQARHNYLQVSLRGTYRESMALADRLNDIFLHNK
ncbi:MAG: hypothetical protein KA116_02325 [Proteobacteria bacterium]|nr:hypothetical protein [Pseudomonadota bacterium]